MDWDLAPGINEGPVGEILLVASNKVGPTPS